MDDDSRDHLLGISVRHQQPIINLLLDIQQEKEQRTEVSSKFLDELECFYVGIGKSGKIKLFREWIRVSREPNYVALSYTWSPSKDEESTKGGYLVQNRNQSRSYPSGVRDCVLDRITKYMKHKDVQLLWIDRHSIPQQNCKDPQCECGLCKKKAAALRSMDWVYKKSNHPVALLGRPINAKRDLDLLYQILTREFASDPQPMGFTGCREWERNALKLLYKITSDLWWQRAWTYQENYKGGKKMILLIPHPQLLEEHKLKCEFFGDVPGELCIKSICFFEKATSLCQIFKDRKDMTPVAEEMIDWILSRAGRYKELLDKSEPMDPAIIADTERRGVKEPWDRLSIVANCCDYPVRLAEQQLRHNGCSLSLSMLGMCLLNGLILYNGISTSKSISKMSVSEFLEAQSFHKFQSPLGQPNLTFNKGCRFIDVELGEVGVGTKGHIWVLDQIIDTATFKGQLPWVDNPRDDLDLWTQKRLTQLSRKLGSPFPEGLANDIEAFLRGEAVGNNSNQFVGDYMLTMAETVADAIQEKKALRLGRLWDPEGEVKPYRAIFVWQDAYRKNSNEKPAFAFTSSQPKEFGTDGCYVNDTNRHVSLEVQLAKNLANDRIPYLHTKRWLLGLCFFKGDSREEVIFPWPQALMDIKPDL
ncbi:hypothetical protein F4821DRAFT_251367 [Hypoxylon rubiginosum]|uniref:Uncharacterized protein n=1 Tax=Hypoxylon rubiginosum TaxID=110542 RepID=A0ACC0CJB8_9PEZI|nr:hypothetical protein F4821DRAFT_251367 [Hypoxylon rubiginosum]